MKAVVGILFALALVWSVPASSDVLRVGLSGTSDIEKSGTYVWARAFAEYLESEGVSVRIYPSSSIGSEIVRTEQVLLGLLEVNIAGTQEVEMLSELFKGLALPFLFEDNSDMSALMQRTDFLESVNEETQPHGMRVVAIAYTGGMEGMFTVGTAIRHPEELSALRLRAMTSQQLAYFEAWGGAGTQVAWEEVPQALQTGIADGYLNPPIVAVMFGHGGQLDYFSDLRLSPSMRVVTVSQKWFDSLDAEERALVEEAIRHASHANLEWSRRMMSTEFDLLRDAGIEVIEVTPTQRDEFRKRLLPLYDDLASPEVQKRVRRYLQQVRGAK